MHPASRELAPSNMVILLWRKVIVIISAVPWVLLFLQSRGICESSSTIELKSFTLSNLCNLIVWIALICRYPACIRRKLGLSLLLGNATVIPAAYFIVLGTQQEINLMTFLAIGISGATVVGFMVVSHMFIKQVS